MLKKIFPCLLLMISFFRSLTGYELAIVSMFRNEAKYLKEWVTYHNMVGVEHFWLYNNHSTDNWEEVLRPYIEKGIVEVIEWSHQNGYTETQVNAFRDGLKRGRGIAKWVALIDIDEFLLPMKEKNIPDCLEKYFSEASGVFANWRNFGTGGVYIPEEKPILGYLTACSLSSHSDNAVGKSIVRPDKVDIEAIWYPHHFVLSLGAYYLNGDGEKMSFRETDLPTDGKHHDKYIRINHYVLRDENFYRNVRLAKANQGFGNKKLLLEHYTSFSLVKDYQIINLIKNKYPDESKKIWGMSHDE